MAFLWLLQISNSNNFEYSSRSRCCYSVVVFSSGKLHCSERQEKAGSRTQCLMKFLQIQWRWIFERQKKKRTKCKYGTMASATTTIQKRMWLRMCTISAWNIGVTSAHTFIIIVVVVLLCARIYSLSRSVNSACVCVEWSRTHSCHVSHYYSYWFILDALYIMQREVEKNHGSQATRIVGWHRHHSIHSPVRPVFCLFAMFLLDHRIFGMCEIDKSHCEVPCECTKYSNSPNMKKEKFAYSNYA